MPVICAVNGVAAGAGASIALACDIVLAARSASFIQAFCKLGLVPDAGGTWVLPRLVGTARAMGLAMLGDKLSAEQAESWGLIWKCLDDDKLMAEAEKLAVHFSTAPTKGLARTKQAIYASGGNTWNSSSTSNATASANWASARLPRRRRRLHGKAQRRTSPGK
jgi:2-(1,2-epoxy-1,2-dihydrophenyl)acetyl-CoA isomerase